MYMTENHSDQGNTQRRPVTTTLNSTKQRNGRKQLAAFLATQLRATVEYL